MDLNWTKRKLHEDNFAPTVNYARITFLHESKKIKKQSRKKN